MRTVGHPAELGTLAGAGLGVSSWHEVSREMVLSFAEITGDRQWVHVDPVRAAEGPFGAPIAHGFLVLGMTTALLDEVIQVEGASLVLNRGVRDARISAPVRAGDRIRARVTLASARSRPRGHWEAVYDVTVECSAERKPVTTLELVFLYREA